MSVMISVLIAHTSIDFCLYMIYIAAVMSNIFWYIDNTQRCYDVRIYEHCVLSFMIIYCLGWCVHTWVFLPVGTHLPCRVMGMGKKYTH